MTNPTTLLFAGGRSSGVIEPADTANKFPQILLAVLVAALFCLTGCASVSTDRIAQAPVEITTHHPICVQLVVAGGGKERFGGMEESAATEYRDALRKLILDSKVFSGICEDGRAGLRLDVAVFKGSQKVHHVMKYEQTIPTNWRLTDPHTSAVLFQEQINGVGVATDFSGASRTVHATERALQDSMVQGLKKLSELKLAGIP